VNIGSSSSSSSSPAGNGPAASCCHADSWEEFLITLQLQLADRLLGAAVPSSYRRKDF
jgi:hypothetical protein